jgi:uncharacterized protein YggE
MTETFAGPNDGGPKVGRDRSRLAITGLTVAALAVGGAALGLSVSNAGGASSTPKAGCGGSHPTLTVKGNGTATATPNVLTAVINFSTTAGSASAALTQDNDKVVVAIFALTKDGVAKSDLQTTGLNIQPNYAYPKTGPVITGYQVNNTLTATLHDIKTAGNAIDDVVTATGNAAQISSLTFSFNHPGNVEDKARIDAVHQAVSHAKAMASAAGLRLGTVCSLTDETQSTQYYPQTFATAGTADLNAAIPAPSVPIESGTQSETDQVTMLYALERK